MNDKSTILSLVAETHIHVGIGQSIGALDGPIAREKTTHYPFIPGSGVKGALRSWAVDNGIQDIESLFGSSASDSGNDMNAGGLLCSDARLLLLPVRCLSDAYKWVTCPAILSRLKRDIERAVGNAGFDIPSVSGGHYLGAGKSNQLLGLEEREFSHKGHVSGAIKEALKAAIGSDLSGQLDARLIIISDTDFTWFAKYALPIMARNALDENKIVKPGALWYEETLSPDTIMYALFSERKEGMIKALKGALEKHPYIQMGGNETIGQGWFKHHTYPLTHGGQ